MKKILSNNYVLWALLSLPALGFMLGLAETGDVEQFLHPTGEFSARFMIISMIITPFMIMFPQSKFWRWMRKRRRYFGVAAFAYAAFHTVLYFIDVGSLRAVFGDFLEFGIWTGWLAFAIFVPLALTSNDRSVRKMGVKWKSLQRWVYVAAVATLLHWMFIHNDFVPAIVNFLPLAILEGYRIYRTRKLKRTRQARA